MPGPRRTLYDDLGVPPDAGAADITRAYNKYRADLGRETVAPDRVRESRMKAAFETLSDPEKRGRYDAMLDEPQRRQEAKGIRVAFAGVGLLAAVCGAAYLMQPGPVPPSGALGMEQIAHAASLAVGRVDSVDISGKAVPLGLAFAIEEGMVVTTCRGITPMSQLSLYWSPRTVPAKVAQVDEKLALCKLATNVGGHTLPVSAVEPVPGDTVYATKMNAVGEVGLVEAKVTKVTGEGAGKAVEISVAVLPERQGGPLLDTRGRVIGVAMLPDPASRGHVVRLTPDWAIRPQAPEAPLIPEPVAAPKPQAKSREELAAERRERLEKAILENVLAPKN